MNAITNLLAIILNIPVYILAKLIPKDKNLYIIGSSLGKYFADNPKYFFLYVQDINQKEKKLIWITKSKSVVKFLRSQKLPVIYLYSLKGIYTSLRASKIFISHQLNDINGPLISGGEIIQLWHGTPIKKIGFNGDWFADSFLGKFKSFLWYIFPYSYYMTCDKLIVPSIFSKNIFLEPFSHSFRNKKIDQNILVLGQPRNDSLLDDYKFNKNFFPEITTLKKHKQEYKFIISWLPTHRVQLKKSIYDLIKETKLNLNLFNDFCIQNNILFVIKPHFLELALLGNVVKDYSNIKLLDAADPYPLLHYTDILITDYSSVYFDFLIKNKPIIFTPFDFKEYAEKVNFYFDYNEGTPGVKCYNWNSVIEQITLLVNNVDEYKHKREKFIDKIELIRHDNCKIIYDYFIDN